MYDAFQAAGLESMQRIRETEENDFYFEFFKRIERNKKSVFLLGDTQEKIDSLKAELTEDYPKLIFAGEYAVETCVGDLEAVINDMNATTTDVIISVLPSPMQEQFLYEHRDKMNANIWYGIGGIPVHKKKHGTFSQILVSQSGIPPGTNLSVTALITIASPVKPPVTRPIVSYRHCFF